MKFLFVVFLFIIISNAYSDSTIIIAGHEGKRAMCESLAKTIAPTNTDCLGYSKSSLDVFSGVIIDGCNSRYIENDVKRVAQNQRNHNFCMEKMKEMYPDYYKKQPYLTILIFSFFALAFGIMFFKGIKIGEEKKDK